jgi:hypothetical protein
VNNSLAGKVLKPVWLDISYIIIYSDSKRIYVFDDQSLQGYSAADIKLVGEYFEVTDE